MVDHLNWISTIRATLVVSYHGIIAEGSIENETTLASSGIILGRIAMGATSVDVIARSQFLSAQKLSPFMNPIPHCVICGRPIIRMRKIYSLAPDGRNRARIVTGKQIGRAHV